MSNKIHTQTKKQPGFPLYVEKPAVVNNIIRQQYEEDKAHYLAIVRSK